MLCGLTIENIGVIDRVVIPFAAGFNVLTGETGAGKSIIVESIGLALGARTDASLLRAGAPAARVEAVFDVEAGELSLPEDLAAKLGIREKAGRLAMCLVREIKADGRGACTVNGRHVSLKTLQDVGRRLVDAHGQRQTMSLMRTSEHRELLDHYGGLLALRGEYVDALHRLRAARAELARIRRDEDEQAARLAQLIRELQAIRDVAPVPGEDDALTRERTRLANAVQLRQLAGSAKSFLVDNADAEASGADALAETAQGLRAATAFDADLKPLHEAAEALWEQAQDIAHALGRYVEDLDTDPNRLEYVDLRVALIEELKDRHGGSIENVIAHGVAAEVELEQLIATPEHRAALEESERALAAGVGGRGVELSRARQAAAARLGQALEAEIADLALQGARVSVQVTPLRRNATASKTAIGLDSEIVDDAGGAGPYGLDESGIDHVEILIAPNDGEPLRPLVKTASGGEMARLMLALKSVLVRGGAPTLVLDEIDVGVGGHVGATVGRKLSDLAEQHQVICVTHLPQVASYASRHLRVVKGSKEGRTITRVEHLADRQSRIAELAQMIGSQSASAQRSVGEMLDDAQPGERNPKSPVTLRLLEAVG